MAMLRRAEMLSSNASALDEEINYLHNSWSQHGILSCSTTTARIPRSLPQARLVLPFNGVWHLARWTRIFKQYEDRLRIFFGIEGSIAWSNAFPNLVNRLRQLSFEEHVSHDLHTIFRYVYE